MPFIVETGPSHIGIKLYISRPIPPGRRHVLNGFRDRAVEFKSEAAARVAVGQFSSLHKFLITEIK